MSQVLWESYLLLGYISSIVGMVLRLKGSLDTSIGGILTAEGAEGENTYQVLCKTQPLLGYISSIVDFISPPER